MLARFIFALTVSCIAATAAIAQTGAMPVVEPYAGSEERTGDRVEEAFGATMRITGFNEGKVQAEEFQGRILLRRFANPPGRSTLEILENYRAALQGRGYAVEWQCSGRSECGNTSDRGWNSRNGMNLGIGSDIRYMTGSLPHEGGTVHVSVGVERSNHYVQVLQSDRMDSGNVKIVDADAMARAIDADGRIALDNIYFDFGSAVLLPESDAAIAEIAKLLGDRGDLSVYIVGHTDSVGTLETNLTLSRNRAQAVVDALAGRFGIASGRAVPAGVGPLAPVASNATEDGRALNRRVEVVAR